MNRKDVLKKIEEGSPYDIVIIGGGATGIGSALDATLRGYKTLLVEKNDFTKGTSSRSTKLIHGGVRYLAQGDIFLVFEALRERGYLMKNAPHLVHNQKFIIPNYRWWEGLIYTAGLTLYDLMSGFLSIGKSVHIPKNKVKSFLPGITEKGLRGGVMYHDAQFDDSRLAIDLLHSAFENGGQAINYFPAVELLKNSDGKINGILAKDSTTGREYRITCPVVINATGVWVDDILKMDQPEKKKLVRPSQGVHLVLDKKFLPGEYALMIPGTSDGRILFAVPWHDHIIMGTTDTPLDYALEEPVVPDEEINFILGTAGKYLTVPPKRIDVLSVFAGLRPLSAPRDKSSETKEISRSHKIIVSRSGLITITGGKWTTYRRMAEDVVNKAVAIAGLTKKKCTTKHFRICSKTDKTMEDNLSIYGDRRESIIELVKNEPLVCSRIHPGFHYIKAEVIMICRTEMVVKLEDIMARRLRVLFLDAKAALEMAPAVASIAATELGWTREKMEKEIEEFNMVAGNYLLKI